MTVLIVRSWLLLFHFDYIMRFREFRDLHRVVRAETVQEGLAVRRSHEMVCKAIDLACVLYFKRVLCLQRSAATTVLLRACGWKASMKIGAQIMPPAFHAWVEIDEVVVNDRPYTRSMYQSLESC